MAGPVGHHVDDVDPSVGVGQHGILLSAVWYRPAPDDQTGAKKNVTVYYSNFFGFFQGVIAKKRKKYDVFFEKIPPAFRAFLRK